MARGADSGYESRVGSVSGSGFEREVDLEVLVIGSGGREHALVWKLARSPEVSKVWCAPGNGGISTHGECVPIPVDDSDGLLAFAKEKKIGLTVVGPEKPLCDGLVDRFRKAGLLAFGPSRKAARIEGSKAWCRELCARHHIPSPQSWTFHDIAKANAFLENYQEPRLVVKASGLAAGKGVTICKSKAEARKAVSDCLEGASFGEAGRTVVLEQFLEGEELSMLALTDGQTIVPLETAKDHKAAFEGDKGPNTGGMGAVSPAPAANARTLKQVESQVLVQGIHALGMEGAPYQGVLYAGLMVTPLGPRVLEFNCRFGDPEAQVLLFRLESDLLPYLVAAAENRLESMNEGVSWDPRPAATVVAVADDYPGNYRKGQRIHGLELCPEEEDFVIFHSGTRRGPEGNLFTNGGRVFAVTAKAATMDAALGRCYEALEKVRFPGMRFRRDIGKRKWEA